MIQEIIRIDSSQMQGGFNTAINYTKRFASDIRGTIAGAFGGAAFVAAVRKTIQEIDQIQDVAEELNMPVEEVQAMKFAADDASDSFEKLLTILTKIQDVQIDIVKGEGVGEKGRNIVGRYGYSTGDINNMKPGDFARLVAKMTREEQQTLLGTKAAAKLQPFIPNILNAPQNAISGMGGRVRSKEVLDEINASVTQGKQVWDSLWNGIFNNLYGIVSKLKIILDLIPRLEGLKENKLLKFMYDWGIKQSVNFMTGEAVLDVMNIGQKKKSSTSIETPPLVENVGDSLKNYHSDSLLSVGNFLGQGKNNFSIGASLVNNTQRTADAVEAINKKMDTSNIKQPSDFQIYML
jgi:hypothetical protein